MKCKIGILFLVICATQLISAWPVRSGGMVFYQPSPDYFNAHRAFVMQYASQPVRSYRRQGQAAVVNAYASGKKIRTGTFVGQNENNDEEQIEQDEQLVHSVAEAGQPIAGEYEPQHDEESEFEQENPTQAVANDEIESPVKKVPQPTQPQADEEQNDDDDDDEEIPVRKSSRGSNGVTYFPVTFGSTNGGAIAIANSYSTGKGGTASSRATAYGSPAKSKATSSKKKSI